MVQNHEKGIISLEQDYIVTAADKLRNNRLAVADVLGLAVKYTVAVDKNMI